MRVQGAARFPAGAGPAAHVWFGGSSEPGQGGGRACRRLSDLGQPAQVKEKLDAVRAKAAARGRQVRFGLRIHLIVRETGAKLGPPPMR